MGASISPTRNWVYYGEHRRTTPDGYGRRVGLAEGLESVVATWDEGMLRTPYQTMADVQRKIAGTMKSPHVSDLRAHHLQLVGDAERTNAINDASVLSYLSRDL